MNRVPSKACERIVMTIPPFTGVDTLPQTSIGALRQLNMWLDRYEACHEALRDALTDTSGVLNKAYFDFIQAEIAVRDARVHYRNMVESEDEDVWGEAAE